MPDTAYLAALLQQLLLRTVRSDALSELGRVTQCRFNPCRRRGSTRRKTPETAYLAALGCFCRPAAGRAGNAENCLRCCVRLFLRAGGRLSRKRQRVLHELILEQLQETPKTAYLAALGCFCVRWPAEKQTPLLHTNQFTHTQTLLQTHTFAQRPL